jgi:hypothetical protein
MYAETQAGHNANVEYDLTNAGMRWQVLMEVPNVKIFINTHLAALKLSHTKRQTWRGLLVYSFSFRTCHYRYERLSFYLVTSLFQQWTLICKHIKLSIVCFELILTINSLISLNRKALLVFIRQT